MKYTGPKVRISRKLGVALTPKAAKVMQKKPHPPGQHGPASAFRRQRPSPYKEQLLEKQKLRAQYNVHEKQLRNYYRKAFKRQGNTADNLIGMLETRLDAVVVRSGIAPTIYAARQYVNHGHFTVNGNRVNIPSYAVRPGDIVQVRQKSRNKLMFENGFAHGAHVPDYLTNSDGDLSIKLNHVPKYEEVQIFAEVPKVIEYYSR